MFLWHFPWICSMSCSLKECSFLGWPKFSDLYKDAVTFYQNQHSLVLILAAFIYCTVFIYVNIISSIKLRSTCFILAKGSCMWFHLVLFLVKNKKVLDCFSLSIAGLIVTEYFPGVLQCVMCTFSSLLLRLKCLSLGVLAFSVWNEICWPSNWNPTTHSTIFYPGRE